MSTRPRESQPLLYQLDDQLKPHVLILEDNFLLAEDLAELVRKDLDGDPLVVHNASDAIEMIPDSIKLAFLDIEVSDGVSYPVAKKLMQHHIPLIFVSGNEKEDVPREFKCVPFVAKPAAPGRLIQLSKSLSSAFS